MQFLRNYFTNFEKLLWGCSVLLIVGAFVIFDRNNALSMVASVIGVTSLIFCAKGNPVGQILMIVFSILYFIISYTYRYYGEMATYIGMTMPMSIFNLVSWLKHPYKGNHAEVAVGKVGKREVIEMCALTVGITTAFFFILRALHTTNLLISTLSVATSFSAVYLSYRRSPYFAVAYAMNDLVLIGMWGMATWEAPKYFSVVICFIAFLANDLYGFASWQRIQKRQQNDE